MTTKQGVKDTRRDYVITKTVTVEYYFNIKANTLRGADQIAKRMEREGDLTFDDGYQWVGVESVEVDVKE